METHPAADEATPALPPEPPAELAPISPEVEAAGEAVGSEPEPPQASSESAPSEPPSEAAPASEVEGDELSDLVARSQAARLAQADEERLTALLKEALLGGKAGVARVVEILPKLAWIVGVRAVEAAWPEMKATGKTQLLKGLGEIDSEPARRMRLSLARALFKVDQPVALKLAAGVAKEMREKESGELSPRNAQIFANVFIGKTKPWVAQLPLGELKPAEADVLVHCAVVAAFSLPHAPGTQLGILKWTAESGRLDKLQEAALTAVTRSVSRWGARWQNALRKEVAELPEAISAALQAPAVAPEEREPKGSEPAEAGEAAPPAPEGGEGAEDEAPRKQRPVYEPRPQRTPEPPRDREDDRESDGEREQPQRRERPVYEPRGGRGGAGHFNLPDALRQIDAHVNALRTELTAAQAKLRQRGDDEGREGRRDRRDRRAPERVSGPVIEGEPTMEELARLNLQLEARNGELQHRITDLLADAEDRAASMGAHGGEQAPDADTQLRALLGLKLQEDYNDFTALESESPSVVVQQHYRELLRGIFEVLQREGVPLQK